MAEAELHVLRARLEGGMRNKAARGELRRALPVGLVWGEQEGEVHFDPDESVVSTIRTVFSKFTELGSVRRVWLWFCSEGLRFPLRSNMKSKIRWVAATYRAIYRVLTNPVYAGAYIYGKSHRERYVDEQGKLRMRTRLLPMAEWPVLLPEHHVGYIDWGNLPSQPSTHRLQRASRTTPGGRRCERRLRLTAGLGHVWKVRPSAAHSLQRQKRLARLPLLGQG